MNKIKIEKTRESIDDVDISEFESNYDIVLPDNYKKFMLKYNGGLVDGNSDVKRILGIKYGKGRVEDYITSHQIYEKNIPDGYLPIAADYSDNPIIMNLSSGDEYGKIILIDMDMDMNETVLAKSFEEFLGVEKIEDL